MIVDAQMHVWEENSPQRPWAPGAQAHTPVPLRAADALREMDRVGVDRCILVPPSLEGDRNDLAVSAAEQHPDRFAVVARVPLELGEPAGAALEELFARPAVLGARAMFSRGAAGLLGTGGADWFFELADRLAMPVVASCPGRQHLLGKVAARYPRLKITICHLGIDSPLRDEEILQPVADVIELAVHPNIAVMASCLPTYVSDPYPFRSLFGPIQRVVEAYGPRRVFWGSDLSRLRCDYAQAKSMFLDELTFLSPGDLDYIMGRAICGWFGWPLPDIN